MKEQQFTAKDGNNADVTSTARWTIEPTAATPPVTIANINAGYATPTKPGVASVTAAVLDGAGNVTASGGATLEVMCRQYTLNKQCSSPWGSQLYANHKAGDTQGTICWVGCALTNLSNVVSINPDTANTKILGATDPQYQYTVQNGVSWLAANYLSNNSITYDNTSSITSDIDINGFTSTPYAISIIDNYLTACKSVIIGIKGTFPGTNGMPHYRSYHYLLVIGKNGDGSYSTFDPGATTDIKNLPATAQIYSHLVFNHQ